MTVSSELLMRYYDGELSPEETQNIEAELAAHPELARELEGLEQLGDFMRVLSDERMAHVKVDVADAVMRKVAESTSPPPARNVVQLHSPRRMRYFAPAVLGLVTLAAAAVLWLRVGPASEQQAVQVPASAPPTSVALVEAPALEPAPEAAEAAAVAIESVDFGTKTGTIFLVSGAGTETPVVWLADDADVKTRRIESL